MKISRESRQLARRLFHLACENGRLVPARALEIASIVATEKPRGALGALKEFSRRVRLELERRHAVIRSAVPLASGEIQKLETSLRAKFGPDVTAAFETRPELIGGLRVKVGSDVWDGSVRGRLDSLKSKN